MSDGLVEFGDSEIQNSCSDGDRLIVLISYHKFFARYLGLRNDVNRMIVTNSSVYSANDTCSGTVGFFINFKNKNSDLKNCAF